MNRQTDDLNETPGFREVWERLVLVLQPDAARTWLKTPNPSLGGRPPGELLEESGPSEILAAIEQLADGVFL